VTRPLELTVFDADGHVYERAEEIFEFLPPPYAGRHTVLGFPLWPSGDGAAPCDVFWPPGPDA